MKRLALLTLLVVVLAVALFPQGGARSDSGIGVLPLELNFPGNKTRLDLYIINSGDRYSRYLVYADDEYAEWFAFEPHDFWLESGEGQSVKVLLELPKDAKGRYSTYVNVIQHVMAVGARTGLGVRLKTTIGVDPLRPSLLSASPHLPMWIAMGVVVPMVLLGGALYLRGRRLRLESDNSGTSPPING